MGSHLTMLSAVLIVFVIVIVYVARVVSGMAASMYIGDAIEENCRLYIGTYGGEWLVYDGLDFEAIDCENTCPAYGSCVLTKRSLNADAAQSA